MADTADTKMRARKGRPTRLDDPSFCKLIAQAFVDGATRETMAETFHVSPWTITQWRKDPRVNAHFLRLVEERVVRVTSRVDAVIEGRLTNPEKLTLRELLDIRKEFLGGRHRADVEGRLDAAATDAALDLVNDPEVDLAGLEGFLAQRAAEAKS